MAKLDKTKKAILALSLLLLALFVLFTVFGTSKNNVAVNQEGSSTPIENKEDTGPVQIDAPAPAAVFESSGGQISPQDYKGQPLLVEFMAVDCPYCQKLAPTLEKVASEYPGVKVLLVGVPGESISQMEGWKKKNLPEADVAVDENREGVEEYNLIGTPTLVWIYRSGDVALYQTGVASEEDLRRNFAKVLDR